MIYCYLFEAKSIQSYLFRSGKLRDVIAASERLDRLIDTKNTSLLYQVLDHAKLTSDLMNADLPDSDGLIRFLRCKGGAFYCYANQLEPLQSFRSLWSLTVQQMFPSMEYTDALTEAATLKDAVDKAHNLLAQDRNTPEVKLPFATAPAQRYQRSGNARVPISPLAKRASIKSKTNDTYEVDLDTELHRQAYQALEMRTSAALQDKFTPEHLKGEFSYPIDLENDFLFDNNQTSEMSREQREAIKDIALIHIDGNGLGLLLRALKEALQGASNDDYRKGFRDFSEALSQATEFAAKKATQFIYDHALYTHIEKSDKKTAGEKRPMIPMRPIVLGGDDITLLCRADLALEYSQIFCREFKAASELQMKALFEHHLKNAELKEYLTASGGILYHKAGHPFTHSHYLVEDLCAAAKKLTKSISTNDKHVGPAALAFHRLSNAVYESFDDIVKRSLTVSKGTNTLQTGQAAYFVDKSESSESPFDFIKLNQMVQLCSLDKTPVSISRWRQMLTCISFGDYDEANRIYHRGHELGDEKLSIQLNKLLDKLTPKGSTRHNWYWTDTEGKHFSIINDLLIAHHFQSKSINPSAQTEGADHE